ncbi:MAG: MotA/TolQ/ExbB proton channel family protein [Planctomycetia bacterium]|nr:MotA/TolQ/ExbB proton channel family protein [Planctomycetia bacterium]
MNHRLYHFGGGVLLLFLGAILASPLWAQRETLPNTPADGQNASNSSDLSGIEAEIEVVPETPDTSRSSEGVDSVGVPIPLVTPDVADSAPSPQGIPSDEAKKEGNAKKKINAEKENDADAEKSGLRAIVVSYWDLFQKGGVLMYPIALMSILTLAIGLERLFSLRKGLIAPHALFKELDKMSAEKVDPFSIYRMSKKYSSSAATVVQALLLKWGRPINEIETEYQQAKDDEANRAYRPIRFLNMAATLTPLMGLLGTVMGMITTFQTLAASSMTTSIGVNRAEQLSSGIYVALITTCAGLIVAIPAAILAHWYEGRIQKYFHLMDRQMTNFLYYLESREGRPRVSLKEYENFCATGERPAAPEPRRSAR